MKYADWYQDWRKLLIKSFGDKCTSCGAKDMDDLEFAHYRPNHLVGLGRGSYKRIRDILANPENYILLCKSCHASMDGRNIKV